jgi:hypothetical protein
MKDLPVKVDWETCVGSIMQNVPTHEYLLPGFYTVWIDTIDGESLPFHQQYETPLEVVSSYIMKGGHPLSNAVFCEQEVVINEPSFNKRVVIHNYPHYFRQKQA